MEKTALIIIDMQVAMFSYEDKSPYNGSLVLENIKKLLNKAHEKKIPVIYVQHTTDDEYKKGTASWEICPKIKPQKEDAIVEKENSDSFLETNLNEILQDLGVLNLIIVGMQTEYCVDTTIRRAFSLGYDNIFVKDAHTTFDSKVLSANKIIEHHNDVIGGSFAELKTTEEVLDML